MTIAIPLYFDPALETAIQSGIQMMADEGVAPYMLSAGIRPHITLSIYRDIERHACQQLLEPLVSALPSLPLTFSYVGIFTQPDPVVFLAPTVTRELLDLHRLINQRLDEVGDQPNPYYLPNTWVPHCTLAVEFEPRLVTRAVEIASRIPLPLSGYAQQICLVEYPSLEHLFTLDFQSPQGAS